MNTGIQPHIVKTSEKEWKPLIEHGHRFEGIFVKSLRYDVLAQRSTSILLKFEPGSAYPYHHHPAGEELLVVEGTCVIEGAELHEGDYLFTPPGGKHAVASQNGCILFFMVPKEVEIIG